MKLNPSDLIRLRQLNGEVINVKQDLSKKYTSKPLMIDGVVFLSVSEATKYLSISESTIRKRLIDTKFNDWFYLDKRLPQHEALIDRHILLDLIEVARTTDNWSDVEMFDTRNITDFSVMFVEVFTDKLINLTKWNISKGEDFRGMFLYSKFDFDISNWNLKNGVEFTSMLAGSNFRGDVNELNFPSQEDAVDAFRIKAIW